MTNPLTIDPIDVHDPHLAARIARARSTIAATALLAVQPGDAVAEYELRHCWSPVAVVPLAEVLKWAANRGPGHAS